jgi:hypothetical protein
LRVRLSMAVSLFRGRERESDTILVWSEIRGGSARDLV